MFHFYRELRAEIFQDPPLTLMFHPTHVTEGDRVIPLFLEHWNIACLSVAWRPT